MKKFISSFIVLTTLLSTTTIGYATEKKELKNIAGMHQYQKIIDKVNKELNTKAKIPGDEFLRNSGFDKNEVYNNITNQTLEEFETNLRTDLEDIKNNFDEEDTYIDLTENNFKNDLENGTKVYSEDNVDEIKSLPKSDPQLNIEQMNLKSQNEKAVREVITQTAVLDYGKVFLESEVFSRTGNSSTYTYSSIRNMGYYKYTDRKHFRTTYTPTYSLDSISKNCSVKYTGVIYSATGVVLTSLKTYTIKYNAG